MRAVRLIFEWWLVGKNWKNPYGDYALLLAITNETSRAASGEFRSEMATTFRGLDSDRQARC